MQPYYVSIQIYSCCVLCGLEVFLEKALTFDKRNLDILAL